MKESYLVPDYFPKFACKMGECRHPCCKGWPISISTDDYFRLLSVSCGPAMRERLDNAVRVSLHPTPEAYAQIAPTWAGDCPLHLPDGRCSVHAMLGADALPAICRLYPRGIRVEDGNECSCANSCEAVIELMMGQKEPIRFVRADLELNPPKAAERAFFFETVGKAQRIRLYFIEIMQRRAFTLPQRLMTLGEALRQMDAALRRKDEARVEALLAGAPLAAYPLAAYPLPDQTDRGRALEAACDMLRQVDERSGSIRSHGEAALALLGRPVIWTRSRRIGRFSLSMRWSITCSLSNFRFRIATRGFWMNLSRFARCMRCCACFASARWRITRSGRRLRM